MAVLGAGVLESMSMAPKSVCVSSLLAGPRSVDLGGAGAYELREEAWKQAEVGGVRLAAGVMRPESAWWKQRRHCTLAARVLTMVGMMLSVRVAMLGNWLEGRFVNNALNGSSTK